MTRRAAPLSSLLGRFSPLSPDNPFNPLRSVTRRRPPKQALDDSHHSLLAELYGDGDRLDVAPFPNMEWWWNAADCGAVSGDEHRQFSIITDVHLYALPIVGLIAQGTLAVRDKETGRTWQIHAKGQLGAGTDCRFEAPGWSAFRSPAEYRFNAVQGPLAAQLQFQQGRVACFGDPEQPPGWYDNNPKGLIPYWVSYRSRFGAVSGTLVLDADGDSEQTWTIDPAESRARFDHQSIHWSLRDVGSYSLPLFAEAFISRPQWSWFHLRLDGGLNVMAYELRNGHTGAVLKRAAAMSDDEGRVALIGNDSMSIRASGKRGSKEFQIERIELSVKDAPVDAWNGEYRLDINRQALPDFSVDYPVIERFRYRAQELCIRATGQRRCSGRVCELRGEGVEEVLDLFSSFGRER